MKIQVKTNKGRRYLIALGKRVPNRKPRPGEPEFYSKPPVLTKHPSKAKEYNSLRQAQLARDDVLEFHKASIIS